MEDNRVKKDLNIGDRFRELLIYIRNFGFSAIVDIGIFSLAIRFFEPMSMGGWPIFISTALARISSSFLNFKLNKSLFIKEDDKNENFIIRYYVLWTSLLLLSASITYLINNYLSLAPTPAKVIADIFLGLFSFNIQRKWVFTSMSNQEKGVFFKLLRFISRFFYRAQLEVDKEIWEEEHVLVGHHQNFLGPINCLIYLPDSVDFWVISHLFSFKECFNMYYNYTFRKEKNLPRIISGLMAGFLALIIPPFLRSARAIPVYRESSSIIRTFKESLKRLDQGRQIMIFPDIDYTSSQEKVGEIYSGFTAIEKLYYSKKKRHIGFVPILVDRSKKTISNGSVIYFGDDISYKNQKDEIARRIVQELNSN